MRETRETEAIAIIGAGCRFPRGTRSLPGFWRLLREGVDVIEEVPPARWDVDRYYHPEPGRRGTMYARCGGFLDDIDGFDPAFFGIAPREAHEMDPQQRLLLEVAWEALEDAGQDATALAGSRTAVYNGVIGMDYTLLHSRANGPAGIDAWYASGREFSFGPGRLSHLLGLRGPSLSVSTACSSSLVAVHLACQSLRGGESDLALAGGVNLMLSPELTIFLCQVRAISPRGRCTPFDAAADGIVRGEGCAMVVLKRLREALADGDDVLAVIRGSAVNHDGASAGLTAPSGAAQQDLLREAVTVAGVAPADVGYVEAHGTGTPLGDPIEVAALRAVLGEDRPAGRPLLLGSLKSNLGHMDSAAGVAGLLKAALILRNREIPPSLHLRERSPRIPWDWPVDVPVTLTAWPGEERPRLAGVSAFGLSGTNAHVVLEAAPGAARPRRGAARPAPRPVLLPLSARDERALTELARACRDRLTGAGGPPSPEARDVAHTAAVRRAHHREHRLAVVGADARELSEALTAVLDGELAAPGVAVGGNDEEREPRVAFAFSGQGGQWPGMGRDLLADEPAFREAFDTCDELIRARAGFSARAELTAPPGASQLARTEVAQPVIFAVQVALAALWRSWGITPVAVTGHSMGEVAAAHVAGALDLPDAVRVIAERGRLLGQSAGSGRMASVDLSEADTRAALAPFQGRLWVAAVNSPRATVVSGEAAALAALCRELTERGVGCRTLAGEYAFHSPAMAPYQGRLATLLAGLAPREPGVFVARTTPGGGDGGGDSEPFTAAYWGRNVREPVAFAAAARELLARDCDAFVEIGPHPVLAVPLAHAADAAGVPGTLVVPSLRRDVPGARTMLGALGALYAAGARVRWRAAAPPDGRVVKLPGYPFQRSRYWLRTDVGAPAPGAPVAVPAPPPAWETPRVLGAPGERPGAPLDQRDAEELVVRAVARVLGHEPAAVGRRQGFTELGMDSITAVELRAALVRETGRPLPATVAFDHPNVARLAAFLSERAAAAPARTPAHPPTHATGGAQPEPIAVIGVGCRFPGGAHGPEGYWRMLCEGVDAIGLSAEGRFSDGTRWLGGWLADVDHFDAQFFRVPPREARVMDPQQRMFLEVAWEALEHAGQPPAKLAGSATGVFVGMNSHDYAELIAANPGNVDAFYGTGNSFCATAGRLSYLLGSHGPSLAVDTACSSSLVAVHLAVRSLRAGECDVALAGGVNVIVRSTIHRASEAAGALAGDGRCKTFDAAADGYNRGEGCGVVVLKPLSRALADGDPVLACVLGTAMNQDGPSSGLTVPHGPAQEALIRQALADAHAAPADLGYVEAHGTGTPLGDPIELQALGAALRDRPARARCLVGSVKTNFGHLEAASGVAGLIKVVLGLHHREVPPHLHFREPSPEIPWQELPFDVPVRRTPWPAGPLAGVSAFGFSGTNAHIVLGPAPGRPELPTHDEGSEDGEQAGGGRPFLLPLSATSPQALVAQAAAVRALLTDGDRALAPHDVCYTASVRRAHHPHRLAVVGRSRAELAERLAAFEADGAGTGISAGRVPAGGEGGRRLVFVFSGHGSHWRGMAHDLLRQDAAFREAVAWCDGHLRRHLGWSVRELLERGEEAPTGPRTQELVFAVQVALARRWRALGVEPAAVVGHSMGEVAAAHAAGVLDIEDAARLMHARAGIQERLVGNGAMGVVGLPEAAAQAAVDGAGLGGRLWTAVCNSARSTVLSGDPAALDEIMATLKARNVFCRRLRTAGAGHCPLVEPLDSELTAALAWLVPRPAGTALYSSVTGGPVPGEALDAAYWGRNLRQRVRFSEAVRALAADGCDAFVEISPDPLLLTFIEQDLRQLGTDAVLVPSLRRQRPGDPDGFTVMLGSLGALHAGGYPVDWERLYPTGGRVVPLPAYPWQRRRHWLAEDGPAPAAARRDGHPLLARSLRAARTGGARLWEGDLDGATLAALPAGELWGARLVPQAAWLEMALAAGRERFAGGSLALADVAFGEPLLSGPGDGVQDSGQDAAQDIAQDIARDGARDGAAQLALTGADFTVHALPPEEGDAALCARGRVAPVPPPGEPAAWDGSDCPEWDPAAATAALERAGVGLAGLRVAAARRGGGHCALDLAWEPGGAVAARWVLPPGLLQAALCAPALAAAGDAGDAAPPLLPAAVARLVVRASPEPGRCVTVQARLTERHADGTLLGEVRLLAAAGAAARPGVPRQPRPAPDPADSGTLLAHASGVALRAPRTVPLTGEARERLSRVLYTQRWHLSPRQDSRQRGHGAGEGAPAGRGAWLLLADQGGVARELAGLLAARGERAVLLGRDEAVGPDGLEKLVREVLRDPGCRGAVHLWALDLPAGDEGGAADLAAAPAGAAYDSVLRLARVLGSGGGGPAAARPAWYVTRGACALAHDGESTAPHAPAHAPLWGLAATAAMEYPAAWGGLLDLDPVAPGRAPDPAAEAAAVLAELLQPDGEDHVALRGGRRLVPRVGRAGVTETALAPPRLDPGGTYLVAEGTGGLGARIAGWLTARGARHVLLAAKDGGTPPAGRERDPRVRTVACDLADPAALDGLLTGLAREGRPLRGVVWLAVDWELGESTGLGPLELTGAIRERALGAWLLDERCADEPLDLFVVFSGVASGWGSLGVARQAPADALLSALAARRRARGRPALCVRWAPWDDLGPLSEPSRSMMVRAGLTPMPAADAVEALDYLVAAGRGEAGVCQVDWGIMLPLYRQTGWPLFDALAADDDPAAAGQAAALRDRMAALGGEERRAALVDEVLAETAVVLGAASSDELQPGEGFFDLGMSSITALELKVRLERRFGAALPTTLAFEYPTPEALAGYLAAEVLDVPQAPEAPGDDASGDAPGDAADDLLARFEAEMAAAESLTSKTHDTTERRTTP